MNRTVRSLMALCLSLVLSAALLGGSARAVGTESGSGTGAASPTAYLVTGYNAGTYSITTNQTVNVEVRLSRTSGEEEIARVVRGIDSFRSGEAVNIVNGADGAASFTMQNLSYTGSGNSLSFTIYFASGQNQTLTIPVMECVPYTEPEEPKPTTVLAPRVLFNSDAAMGTALGAGETRTITMTVQTPDNVALLSPILTVTPSSELTLAGQNTFLLDDIRVGQSGVALVTVRALDKLASQTQTLSLSLSYRYNNGSAVVDASATGSVSLATTPSSETADTSGVASPTPIVILSQYNYGGTSVAAGSSTNLSFSFKNTSKTIAIENVMVTVSGGTDLMINGSTNTFYFDTVAASGTQSVSVPLKASQLVSSSAQAVGIAITYEYVDQGQRKSGSANLTLSVPLYQPDRFELGEPKVAYTGYVGEETSLTIDYVNKGKSAITNVEAYISGDVDTYSTYQRVGTIDGGKNGTIAFAVTPYNEGANAVTIQIIYEDANGNSKERVFETSVEAMAYPVYEPSDEDMGYIEEPTDEGAGIPWKYIIAAAVVLLIIALIVVRKKKKKAKMLAEQALWDKWDEEEAAKEAASAAGSAESEAAAESTAGVGEQGQ